MIFNIVIISTQQNKNIERLILHGFLNEKEHKDIVEAEAMLADNSPHYFDCRIVIQHPYDLVRLASIFGKLEVSVYNGKPSIFLKDWESA
jgi:hypothetical protein